MSKESRKRKPTVLNPKGAGRKPMFKKEYGKTKRISVSIPSKKEREIKAEIDVILEPYKC
jgi:hypothetical protein